MAGDLKALACRWHDYVFVPTKRQFAGEPSSKLSVAGSYHRARALRTASSRGRVFVRTRHASSSGPPVQRSGIHCSGVVVAKGRVAHNNKKSANTRRNLAVDCGKAVDLLEANPRTSFVYATGSEESVTGATTV